MATAKAAALKPISGVRAMSMIGPMGTDPVPARATASLAVVLAWLLLPACAGSPAPSEPNHAPGGPLTSLVSCDSGPDGTYRLLLTLKGAVTPFVGADIRPLGIPDSLASPDPAEDLIRSAEFWDDTILLSLAPSAPANERLVLRLTYAVTSRTVLRASELGNLEGMKRDLPLGSIEILAARRDGPLVGLGVVVGPAAATGAEFVGLDGVRLVLGDTAYAVSAAQTSEALGAASSNVALVLAPSRRTTGAEQPARLEISGFVYQAAIEIPLETCRGRLAS